MSDARRKFLFDGCEWNPQESRAALESDDHFQRVAAEVVVGADGQWRLCQSCANLPRFARFRTWTEIPRDRQRAGKDASYRTYRGRRP